MKEYQKEWMEELKKCKTYDDDSIIHRICKEIIEDDTGDTDPLTQELASLFTRTLKDAIL